MSNKPKAAADVDSLVMPEPPYDDDWDDESEYCECGMCGSSEEELASNKCDACGRIID